MPTAVNRAQNPHDSAGDQACVIGTRSDLPLSGLRPQQLRRRPPCRPRSPTFAGSLHFCHWAGFRSLPLSSKVAVTMNEGRAVNNVSVELALAAALLALSGCHGGNATSPAAHKSCATKTGIGTAFKNFRNVVEELRFDCGQETSRRTLAILKPSTDSACPVGHMPFAYTSIGLVNHTSASASEADMQSIRQGFAEFRQTVSARDSVYAIVLNCTADKKTWLLLTHEPTTKYAIFDGVLREVQAGDLEFPATTP